MIEHYWSLVAPSPVNLSLVTPVPSWNRPKVECTYVLTGFRMT